MLNSGSWLLTPGASQPLLQIQRQRRGNDGVNLTEPFAARFYEHGLLQFLFFFVMVVDGKIGFGDVFGEISAAREPDRAARAADGWAEDAADVRSLVIDHAYAVLERRAGHLCRSAGDRVDGGQGFEQRVLAGKGLFLFQEVYLLIGFRDHPFPDGSGNLFQCLAHKDRVEERDVEEPDRAALVASLAASDAMFCGSLGEDRV